MNVFQSAGGAARAENDLNMLFLNAHKKAREDSQVLNKIPGERDIEFGRKQNIGTQQALAPLKADVLDLQKDKVIISIIQTVAPIIMSALSSSSSSDSGDSTEGSESSWVNNVNWGQVIDSAIFAANTYVQLQMIKADREKLNANRRTMGMEMASIDAATQQLDASGRG